MSRGPSLREVLSASAGDTRRAPNPSHVTTVLGAPRVPVELRDPCERDDEPTRDLSPMARLALLSTDLDPIAASCAVKLLEAYVDLDADHKVLLMAVAQAFRERCGRG